MEWQEQVALLVVALTAAAFGWRALRRRRAPGLPCGTSCGCSPASPPPATTYAARKGERPRLHVKANS